MPDAAALSVRDLVALYLTHSHAVHLHCPQALVEREHVLRLFVADRGDNAVADCKPFHLSDWIEGHASWKSSSTRRTKASVVRAAFQWAADGERIGRNPFKMVRYEEAERRPELPDVTIDLVARLANKPFEHAVRWLRFTGCRLSELAEAMWADVDLERGIWTIPKHKSRRKTKRAKVVALVEEAVGLLRYMAGARAATQTATAVMPLLASETDKADGVIFRNTRGTPWNRRTLGQTLYRMKGRGIVQTVASLHGIRHRAATAAIAAGVPLKLVAEQLGHSSTAVTERFYWHASLEHVDAIRDAFGKGMPKK